MTQFTIGAFSVTFAGGLVLTIGPGRLLGLVPHPLGNRQARYRACRGRRPAGRRSGSVAGAAESGASRSFRAAAAVVVGIDRGASIAAVEAADRRAGFR